MNSQAQGGSEALYASAYVGSASSLSSTPRSPWEALSTSPSLSSGLSAASVSDGESLQLAPEVESGNVEYKLKLCNPTPERFTRLVTQLKWRLLAGSGQALYEIGVSDSGQLVGLSPKDLELSLQTLEQMAGELGATMIIQKEITIPSAPGKNLEYLLGNGHVDGAPRLPKLPSAFAYDSSADISPLSLTDTEGHSSPEPAIIGRGSNVGHKFGRKGGMDDALRRASFGASKSASPQPIIREYPYGFDSRGHPRTTSSPSLSLTPASTYPVGTRSAGAATPSITIQTRPSSLSSGPTSADSRGSVLQSEEITDSDVDDDAAFAFDLDISNFTKTTKTKESTSSSMFMMTFNEDLSKTVTLDRSRPSTNFPFLDASTYNPRYGKHKKPKLIQAPALDPAEKARRRREKRDAKREQTARVQEHSDQEVVGDITLSHASSGNSIKPAVEITLEPSIPSLPLADAESEAPSTSGSATHSSASETEYTLDSEPDPADPDDAIFTDNHQLPQTPAPRLIAEVLVVRKFTIEVEEAYLELDKLAL